MFVNLQPVDAKIIAKSSNLAVCRSVSQLRTNAKSDVDVSGTVSDLYESNPSTAAWCCTVDRIVTSL